MKKILTITIIFLTMFVSAPVSAANVCYQCNSHSSVYKWGSNSDADSSCPGGYHQVSLSEMECLGKGASYKSVSCAGVEDIPAALPKFISNIVNLIKIITPIILIIMGMTDFLRSTIANDEKGMNEGKTRFIKRTIAGVIVFLVISVVQLIFSAIGTEDARSVSACINCFLNGNCNSSSNNTQINIKKMACYQCNSDSSKYIWNDGNPGQTNSCPGGYHSVSLSENECKNVIECSNYTTLSECNAATDSDGNKCLWNISGVCEIEENIKCSDYTNRSECNVSVDSDGNKCLWNVSSGCEIDDPNALG